MTAFQFLRMALDPRGRVSRKGLLAIAALLIAIEILGAMLIWQGAFAPNSTPVLALKALFIWTALAAASKRLHDLGLSAWWIFGAAGLQLIWTTVLVVAMFVSFGIEQMQPGSDIHRMMLAGCFTPVFTIALWLHITEGQPAVNRFGATPGPLGFSDPSGRAPFWTNAVRP